ncbi:hypothetical protein SLEP1_g683 [Rubroshorea leprosula]|uniref:Retrovirus-related Pol polyprotein from transposon TNT 1-94 n=1 Tax=Rubroshorea leprosula TaxID=152421 RepID=A0AAV5HKB7_9ROSI|nr:hypothetical protein SLEP1_g683 [Rubroshorea leprosula]
MITEALLVEEEVEEAIVAMDEARGDQAQLVRSTRMEKEATRSKIIRGSSAIFARNMGTSSGCSNHMTSVRRFFQNIDETVKLKVQLGDNNVGQLVENGYLVEFHDGLCEIKCSKSDMPFAKIPMAKNKMFPLEISCLNDLALVANVKDDSKLWHLRYGHLHFNGLKLLSQKKMVYGLPSIVPIDDAEAIATAVHILNISPTKAVRNMTLYEAGWKWKPNEWENSMKEEIDSIKKNNTWELVDKPEGKTPIGVKWVYRVKYKVDGSVQKYKARLVGKGYVQKHGIDFLETFSRVARFEIVRLVIALAAQMKWKIFQFDVKSTFLNGWLEEDVYVEQPEGFIVRGKEEKVYKLKKALYRLKQAPRTWYGRLDSYLHDNDFHRNENEPTLYVKVKGGDILIICVYVDDIIYTGSSNILIEEFKKNMSEEFKKNMSVEFDMSDLGLLHYFLRL